jgi:hypothetical protein
MCTVRPIVGLLTLLLIVGAGALPLAAWTPLPKERPKTPKDRIRVLVVDVERDQQKIADRLRKLKFEVELQKWDQFDPLKVKDIDVILLPTQWAEAAGTYEHLESKQPEFHKYIERGGGLLVCQPNPPQKCEPKLLPYPILFENWYNGQERENLGQDHFITEDLPDKDMPFAADPMLKVDRRYRVLAKQKGDGHASLAVCNFGDGRVVVQTANENYAASVKLSDEILRRMVVWAAGREPRKEK